MNRFGLLAIGLLVAGSAHGAPLYKCVGADGKTTYSGHPCEGKVASSKTIGVPTPAGRQVKEEAPSFRPPPNPVPPAGDPAFLSEAHRAQYLQLQQAENMRRKADEAERGEPAQNELSRPARDKKTELDRRLADYLQVKADTEQRVKADEAPRAEASRLWHCRRGPAPEKCK